MISDAGATTTYRTLLSNTESEAVDEVVAELDSFSSGRSFVTLYLGLEDSPEFLGVGGETYWINNSWNQNENDLNPFETLRGNPDFASFDERRLQPQETRTFTGEELTFMTFQRMIVMSLYGTNALVSLVLGGTYLLRNTFMPYHEAALGTPWAQLDPSTQVLLEALMDVAGAGWIVLGLATLALLLWPVRNGERWSRFLVPVLLRTFYGPSFAATLSVLFKTVATPPWYDNAIACGTTVLGFVLDRPGAERLPEVVNGIG